MHCKVAKSHFAGNDNLDKIKTAEAEKNTLQRFPP